MLPVEEEGEEQGRTSEGQDSEEEEVDEEAPPAQREDLLLERDRRNEDLLLERERSSLYVRVVPDYNRQTWQPTSNKT